MPRPTARGMAARAASTLRTIAGMAGSMFSGVPITRINGTSFTRFRQLLPGATRDWEREAGDAWSNSVVALGLGWIGDRVARPRLRVCRMVRGEEREIPNHGLVSLWTRPNDHYGRRTLEKAIVLSLKVDGNAFVFKRRDNVGRVCELWWLPHWRVQPVWEGDDYITGYLVKVDGLDRFYPASEIIHVRDGIDPRNERLGLASLKACLREACTINQAAGFEAGLMLNGGIPGVAIIPLEEDDIPDSQAEADQMKEKWRDDHSGDAAGGAAVFRGRYDIKVVGFSPEQLALDKLPQAAQARLASATGVAAMSIGLNDPNKTYANLGEANRTSWGSIVAVQELIAEALRDDLATETIQYKGRITEAVADPLSIVVRYDYSQIEEMQESLDSKHARVREDWKADLVRRSEAQQLLGYEVDEAELETGGPYFSEIAAAQAQAAQEAAAAAEPDPDEPAGEGEEPEEADVAAPKRKGWSYWDLRGGRR